MVNQIDNLEDEVVTEAAYVLFYKLRGFEESIGLVNNEVLDFAAIMQQPKLADPLTSSGIKVQNNGVEFAAAIQSSQDESSEPSKLSDKYVEKSLENVQQ